MIQSGLVLFRTKNVNGIFKKFIIYKGLSEFDFEIISFISSYIDENLTAKYKDNFLKIFFSCRSSMIFSRESNECSVDVLVLKCRV